MADKYKIEVMETAKAKIPLRKVMKDGTLPRFPFSILISGRSGSGKTNLLLNLLTRKEFYKNYFHYVMVFSPTASVGDDMYDVLDLPEENIRNDFTQEDLDHIIEVRKNLIKEKGIEWVAKNSRMLIILDDIIANRNFLMAPASLKMFALLRHYLCSVIVLTQSYNKIPRALRLNCNAVFVFPASQSEVEVLIDEITPAGIKKRDFENVIEYATAEQYQFLYINNHAKPSERIRKNLTEIIDLDKFKKKNKTNVYYNKNDEQINHGIIGKPECARSESTDSCE
jgi:hypothetical protein